MIKAWLFDFFDERIGQVLLGLALVWGGLCLYANRYEPLPAQITDVPKLDVYVDLEQKALSKASAETYFVSGPADNYVAGGRFVFVPETIVKQFVPVELDTPPLSVKRPPQLLPDPGPSLEGADKLPRFGDEFPPPSAADLPPPPKGGAIGGAIGGAVNK